MTTALAPVPVPAVPPRPAQVTLIGSSISPPSDADIADWKFEEGAPTQPAAVYTQGDEKIAELRWPRDLLDELEARDAEEKWIRQGISYLPENQYSATARAIDDISTNDNPDQSQNASKVTAVPVWFYVPVTFTSLGYEELDYAGRAERQIENAISAALEMEFWDGQVALQKGYPTPFLTLCTTNLTPMSGPLSITRGLSTLQDYARSVGFGGQAMIHCQPGVTPNLLSTRRQGKLLLDQFDNPIVPGAGYSGNGPGADIDQTPITITNVTESTGVVTYTAANSLTPGQIISIRGIPGAGYKFNLTNVAVVTASGTEFTVHSAIDFTGVTYTSGGTGYVGGVQAAAGTSYMYVTDLVVTRVQKKTKTEPSSYAEALTRGQVFNGNPDYNSMTFRAGKFAVAYFDMIRLACVQVNLPS